MRSDENEPTEMLQLEKHDLYRMSLEYGEIYEELFRDAFSMLQKTISIKLYAVEKCQKELETWVGNTDPNKKSLDYDLKLMSTEEINDMTLD